MYLLTPLDVHAFMEQVKQCRGDVELITVRGDRLDLRSELCQLLFTVAASNGELQGATIICSDTADVEILKAFLTDQTEKKQGELYGKQ